MRQRLHRMHTPAALAEIYAVPHDHSRWPDHIERVNLTIAFARGYLGPVRAVADLSCGSAAIARGLDAKQVHLGDLAPGYEHHGPIEQTIGDIPHVDAFVCCETLEHLDKPDADLRAVRAKTSKLIASTPIEAWNEQNIEHYWAWSRADVEEMLEAVGFTVDAYMELPVQSFYRWGLWGCS